MKGKPNSSPGDLKDLPGGESFRLPFISVLITAHGRERWQYLREAIKSVKNQTLDKSKFEVIIVRDYPDASLDAEVGGSNINVVNVADNCMGCMIKAGIEQSKGDVIAFLDDDDLFSTTKLEFVYDNFQELQDLGFLHNYRSVFGSTNETPHIESHTQAVEAYELIVGPSDWSHNIFDKCIEQHGISSCISIRREILIRYADDISHLTTNPDTFFFFCAVLANSTIKLSKEVNTYYRTTASVTRIVSNYNDYWKRLESIHSGDRYILSKFETYFKGHLLESDIQCYVARRELVLALLSPKASGVQLLARSWKHFFSALRPRPFISLLALLLHDISPIVFRKLQYNSNLRYLHLVMS